MPKEYYLYVNGNLESTNPNPIF